MAAMTLTLDEILSLRREKPDEFCCLVAEKVLGYEWRGVAHGKQRLYCEEIGYVAERYRGELRIFGYGKWHVPEFHNNAADDLAAHRAACKRIFSKRQAYFAALTDVLRRTVGVPNAAWPDLLAHYAVGDYASAALSVSLSP